MTDELPPITDNEEDESIGEQQRYEQELARVKDFRDELVTLLYKSQDAFEKQLSFISAGALGLSIGFIKELVSPFEKSIGRGLLGLGWGALILTLLLNCVSHLLSAQHTNKTIKEINEDAYDPQKVISRNKWIVWVNWSSVGLMILGITLIVSFITKNTLMLEQVNTNSKQVKIQVKQTDSTKGLTSSTPPPKPKIPPAPPKPKEK